MKADFAHRWTDMLRSGQYRQARGVLRQWPNGGQEGYCCLGLLCVLYDNSRWDGDRYSDPETPHGRSGMPPNDVLKAVDLPFEFAESLSRLNDSGTTFGEIADLIEREILGE